MPGPLTAHADKAAWRMIREVAGTARSATAAPPAPSVFVQGLLNSLARAGLLPVLTEREYGYVVSIDQDTTPRHRGTLRVHPGDPGEPESLRLSWWTGPDQPLTATRNPQEIAAIIHGYEDAQRPGVDFGALAAALGVESVS